MCLLFILSKFCLAHILGHVVYFLLRLKHSVCQFLDALFELFAVVARAPLIAQIFQQFLLVFDLRLYLRQVRCYEPRVGAFELCE